MLLVIAILNTLLCKTNSITNSIFINTFICILSFYYCTVQTQAHYCLQRNVMCDALVKAFSSTQCTFEIPDGGMFLWLRFKSKKEVRICTYSTYGFCSAILLTMYKLYWYRT